MQLSERILDIFKEIARVPRQSKHEEKIAAWLVDRAHKDGFDVDRDAANNVIIRVPATAGYEKAPIIVLQGHMDMVCEKTPSSKHNFDTDPIEVIVGDDGWMHANDTSLGADDGLGVATALALAEDSSVCHPALEILITSDEETGMTGATALRADQLRGRILVNLDSEDEGVITVGCAGGRETRSELPLSRCAVSGAKCVRIHIAGLLGGHSGTDIACGRASAIKLAVRVIQSVLAIAGDAKLIDIKAGSAHNAIPRDAVVQIAVSAADVDAVSARVAELSSLFASEYAKTDKNVHITVDVTDYAGDAYDTASLRRLADALLVFPHGVAAMSQDVKGLVETSANLAAVHIADGKLHILSSQRSSVPSKLDAITSRIDACMRLAGGEAHSNAGYPGWKPDMDSDVLKRIVRLYNARFGHDPIVDIIHAGLECGLIGAKMPDMQMVSLGPTVVSPHSPQERADVRTIPMVADLMVDLLASYKA